MTEFEDKVITLLDSIYRKLNDIESECSSIASHTWYLDSDIKDDISDIKNVVIHINKSL